MVLTKVIDNRWMRRYKIFFFVGVVILLFQLFLAIRFFTLSKETSEIINVQNPYKVYNLENNDVENSVNSARRSKDGLVLDDEDIHINHHKTQGHIGKTDLYKKTKAQSNQTHLRLEELDFIPPCEIHTKEAISAIHRAKTQKCKKEISNVTCLIYQGIYYPTQLPNYCPNNGLKAGKSLGCFKDEKTFRLLNGYYGNNKNTNSPEYCIRLCLQSGFPYAGVQYSTECFCGNDEPPSTARLPDSSCNMKCPANPHQACGGYYTINIYQTGISKFVPQTVETTTVENTKSAKIVFLLTLNGRALRQVKRLLKILYHKDHFYYIHVDVRQDYLFRELLLLEKQFPNIRLTRKRFATIWGGASLLQMLLSCVQELLHLDWQWDFTLNLSESDYPVKTLSRLVEFLSANKNKNFVKSHGREVQRFIQKQGLDKTFIECDTHMWRTGDRKLPWGIQIDGGSDWVALSRNFVEYVATNSPDELVSGLFIIFKHTLLPAESFFHTVLRNSKFCNTYVDNNLHVTNWKRKLGCKCQYKHVVDWCGCSPNDFKPEDWLRIQNTESRQLFFARKFEPIINQAVILQLEQWLYETDALSNIPNINSYWHSIYNYLDHTPLVDDSLITLSMSAIRIKSKHISNKTCIIVPIKVLEVTSFHKDDIYQKTLILYEANKNNNKVKLEIAIKPRNKIFILKSSILTERLQTLIVSSDYDQKEQVLLNFAQILGPYSEPVLFYRFNSSPFTNTKVHNITFLWIDPASHLIEVNEVTIDDASVTGHVKPVFKQPLLPGLWIVKMIESQELLAEIKFLITPLEFLSGNIISQNQVNFIHAGSDVFKDFDTKFDKFLPNTYEKEVLERLTVSNSKRFGPDLQEWIDSLFNKFFIFTNICAVNNSIDICGNKIINCANTNWSSFAPDPKSSISKINETSGSFDLW